MTAAHSRIATVRMKCNTCAYPKGSEPTGGDVRFAPAAAAAHNTASDVFVAATFTRCNVAAVASSMAAAADTGGDVIATYAGICTTRTKCIDAGDPPASEPQRAPLAAYFTASDAYATASFTRCNADAVASSVAATAQAFAELNACKLGDRTNPAGCSAAHTTTMKAAHSSIAIVRANCNSCAYPPASKPDVGKIRYAVAAEAAYNTASDLFIAATFTRCNVAAVASSMAAAADAKGDVVSAYLGICETRTACIAMGDPPASEAPRSPPAAYFTASDAYATAVYTRCNIEAVASSVAATAQAFGELNVCTLGDRTDPAFCSAAHTATMVAAHSRIATIREACNACAYPKDSGPDDKKVRFAVAASAAHTTASDLFIAATFTRCNVAAVASSMAAAADSYGDVIAAYTGICATRTECIAMGDSPDSEPNRAPTGELDSESEIMMLA